MSGGVLISGSVLTSNGSFLLKGEAGTFFSDEGEARAFFSEEGEAGTFISDKGEAGTFFSDKDESGAFFSKVLDGDETEESVFKVLIENKKYYYNL